MDKKSIIANLRARGIDTPVLVRPDPKSATRPRLPDDPPIMPEEGGNTWSMPSKSEPGVVHIIRRRRRSNKIIWACGPCKRFAQNRSVGCEHIDDVRDFIGDISRTDASGVPYKRARRRDLPLFYYPEGQLTHDSRRGKVARVSPRRRKEMALELARLVHEPQKPSGSPVGQPPVPMRVVAYALLRKVQECWTYGDLKNNLSSELDELRQIGWNKRKPPSITKLCQEFARTEVGEAMQMMIRRTASCGRKIDDICAIDATGLGITMTANYSDQKHRSVKPRPRAEFLKMHTFVGVYTSLIGYVVFTLSHGEGTADTSLFRLLLDGGLQAQAPSLLLGDAAYGDDDNYAYSEARGVKFMARFKTTAIRGNMRVASQMAAYDLFVKDYPKFQEIYRYRTKIEGAFSALKRTTKACMALQHRRSDVLPVYPAPIPKPESARERLTYKQRVAERWAQVLEIVPLFVGGARTNEGYAKVVAHNIQQLVRLEIFHDDTVNFAANKALEPILTMEWAEAVA